MALPVLRRNHDNGNELVRSDPLTELDSLNRQLGDLLSSWRHVPSLLGEAFTPLADVEESDDAYTVEVELPGVKKDDMEIGISGRRITVRGERKERQRVGMLRRRERVVGRFEYEVVLPGEVEEDGVEAHLDEGVLTIRAPKPARDRRRRIEIR